MIDLTLTDPIDSATTHSRFRTIAIGIQHEGARKIGVDGFAKWNTIFDAYRSPELLLPIFFAVPCFLRIIDEPTFLLLEETIRSEYNGQPSPNRPPLVVIGGQARYQHHLIFNSTIETTAFCWNLYREVRRKAKYLERKQLCK